MSRRKQIRAYLNQRDAANTRFARRVLVMAVLRKALTAQYGQAPPAWLIIRAVSKIHTGDQ